MLLFVLLIGLGLSLYSLFTTLRIIDLLQCLIWLLLIYLYVPEIGLNIGDGS
jgi:hypothetical protein